MDACKLIGKSKTKISSHLLLTLKSTSSLSPDPKLVFTTLSPSTKNFGQPSGAKQHAPTILFGLDGSRDYSPPRELCIFMVIVVKAANQPPAKKRVNSQSELRQYSLVRMTLQ